MGVLPPYDSFLIGSQSLFLLWYKSHLMFSEGIPFNPGEKWLYFCPPALWLKIRKSWIEIAIPFKGVDTRYTCYYTVSPVFLLTTFQVFLQLSLAPFLGLVVVFTGDNQGKMGLCHLVWTGIDLWYSSCSVNIKISLKKSIESQSPGRVC